MEKSEKISKITAVTGVAIFVALFIGLYVKFGSQLLAFVSDTEGFKAWLSGYKGLGAVIFVAIRSLQTVIKIIPAEPLEIAAGYVYGSIGGGALCLLGSVIGSVAILGLVRVFGKKLIDLFVPKKLIDKYSALNDESRVVKMLFIIYLIPSTPKDVITYLSGLLNIKPWKFLLITSIARIPSIITSTICGAQLGQNNFTLAAAVFIGTFVVGIAGTYLYEKYEKRHRIQKGSPAMAA